MHQSSIENKKTAYKFILIVLLHFDNVLNNHDTYKLIESVKNHASDLYFILDTKEINKHTMMIELAFWLSRKKILLELLESKILSQENEKNAFFSLIELKEFKDTKKYLTEISKNPEKKELSSILQYLLDIQTKDKKKTVDNFFEHVDFIKELSILIYLAKTLLYSKEFELLNLIEEKTKTIDIPKEKQIFLDVIFIKKISL